MNKFYFIIPGLILTISSSFTQAQTPVKKVLMEEFTTVLCGVCPPVTYNINQFHQSHPNSILVTLHEGFGRDSMSNPTSLAIYDEFKPTWGSFAPAIMIERTVYPTIDTLIPYLSTFTSGYDTLVTNALLEPPMVGIEISTQYFPGFGGIYTTVTSTFVDPLPAADYRVNLFLVEDSVTGVGYPGYAQKCYDAGFVAQHYPGYPYANDTISGYPHRYVLRQTLTGNAFGTSQTVPVLAAGQSPVLNTPYVFTMATPFIIPFNYNFDRLHLVASVNRYENGSFSGNYVINANSVKLSDNISTGINTSESIDNFHVFPNPALSDINIAFDLNEPENLRLSLIDITGRVVYAIPAENYNAGNHSLKINSSSISPGIYTLQMLGEQSKVLNQVVITK